MDWKAFFESYRLTPIKSDADLLYQMGTTVGGKAISPDQLSALLSDCRRALDLRMDDTLLDLCAGNGMLTAELASSVKAAVGVDFSRPYIENARLYKSRPNVTYLVHDVSSLETCEDLRNHVPASKVMCYGALGYLTPDQVESMLRFIAAHSTPGVRVLFGSVLDKARIWKFFNTWSRKLNYFVRIKLMRTALALGRWWTRDELRVLAARTGFACEFIDQDRILHTAHYRTDVLLQRRH